MRRWNVTAASFVVLLWTCAPLAAQTIAGPQCLGDKDGDSHVTVDEIVNTVDNALNGCASDEVTIEFQGMVGDQTFACGTQYEDIGLSHDTIIPSDFRLYIHNIRLIDDRGREVPVALVQDHAWQLEDLVLLDFENKQQPCNLGTAEVNSTVRGTVPVGDYKGIRFSLGVPFRLNHDADSQLLPPLTLSAMFWGWQAGYKFLRIDELLSTTHVHLGSTGCVAVNPTTVSHCDRPNVGEVYLPKFDPAADIIAVDVKALLADSDLQTNQQDTPAGCESGPNDNDCGPILQNLGVNFSNGLPDPSRQKFFRVLE